MGKKKLEVVPTPIGDALLLRNWGNRFKSTKQSRLKRLVKGNLIVCQVVKVGKGSDVQNWVNEYNVTKRTLVSVHERDCTQHVTDEGYFYMCPLSAVYAISGEITDEVIAEINRDRAENKTGPLSWTLFEGPL